MVIIDSVFFRLLRKHLCVKYSPAFFRSRSYIYIETEKNPNYVYYFEGDIFAIHASVMYSMYGISIRQCSRIFPAMRLVHYLLFLYYLSCDLVILIYTTKYSNIQIVVGIIGSTNRKWEILKQKYVNRIFFSLLYLT